MSIFDFKELEKQDLDDFKKRKEELGDWLTKPVREYKGGKGILEHIIREEIINEHDIPIWRFAFNCMSESGRPTTKDTWILDKENMCLIKIPAGSTTARCLLLEELDKLPKEEGL